MENIELFPSNRTGTSVPNKDYACPLDSFKFYPIITKSTRQYFKDLEYVYFPSTQVTRIISNSSRVILQHLTTSRELKKVNFGETLYYIGQGLLLDSKENILLCLTTTQESNYVTYTDSRHFKEEYYQKDYVLFLATELYTKPENTVLLRRLQKIYIDFCYLKGVEVRVVPSETIRKNTFAKEFKLDFNSITDMQDCLRNEIKYLLNESSQSRFINHMLFVKPQLPEMDLEAYLLSMRPAEPAFIVEEAVPTQMTGVDPYNDHIRVTPAVSVQRRDIIIVDDEETYQTESTGVTIDQWGVASSIPQTNETRDSLDDVPF